MMDTLKQASDQIPNALSLPPKWINMYGDFVTKNASSVSQIESALRSLTYIIPGRFRESEIASESLHSTIQLLSLYHDSLLARAVSRLPLTKRPHPHPHNRYTQYWSTRSPLYRRLARAVQMIQYVELLCEMAAKRRSERTRWRVIVLLELVKAMCRLVLLRITGSRQVVSPPVPERDVDPTTLEEPSSTSAADEEMVEDGDTKDAAFPPPPPLDLPIPNPSGAAQWTMPRTGLTLPSLPNPHDISAYLLSKVLTADDVKAPRTLLHRVTGAGQLAEVAHILRPVVYALALAQVSGVGGGDKKKGRNWRPWLLGISLEYGARQLAKREVRQNVVGGFRGMSGLEREELRRRGWAMGWWLLRGGFYEGVSRTWLDGFTSRLKDKPLLGLLGGVVEDYEYLWDNYYFATATM